MKFKKKKVEDCFDGSRIFEYALFVPVGPGLIEQLGTLGNLEYFRDFPRPFYRIITDSGAIIKGIEGENYFRVIYTKSGLENEMPFLDNKITDI